nr:MAG TPA: Major head protein [Caudoviricetes sp.]
MSEVPTAEAKVEETTKATPPWERDGETFDPERAWKLVQNLKAELAAVKAKQAEAPEPTAAEEPAPEPEAEPTEAEAPEPQDDSAAQIASLQAELARVKALAAVGLSQDFAPFVPGATSEEIEKNLATLQKLISDAANEKTEAVLAAAPKSRGMAPNPAQHAAPARDAYAEAAEIIFG